MSIPVWLMIFLCVVANSGPLRLPLAIATIAFMAVGIYTDNRERHASNSNHIETEDQPQDYAGN